MQLLLIPIFKVGLANYNFLNLFSRDKCISHYFDSKILKIAINMIETTNREEKNLPSKTAETNS